MEYVSFCVDFSWRHFVLTVSTGNYCELVSLDVHEESFDVTGYFIYVLGSMEVCLVYTILRLRFYIYLCMYVCV